jgi:uncharacterized membrane protein
VIPWKSATTLTILENIVSGFFVYIWLVQLAGGTLYSVFRIHLAHLRYRWHIVFDFSHTFASVTLPPAHCIRFFAYIYLLYLTGGTLYSVFRIHLARLACRWHIVFGFSHTFGSFSLPAIHCNRLSAYIWLVYLPSAHCIWFFAYIWLVYLPSAHCVRFFAYFCLL